MNLFIAYGFYQKLIVFKISIGIDENFLNQQTHHP
jgi:hypothetical protein